MAHEFKAKNGLIISSSAEIISSSLISTFSSGSIVPANDNAFDLGVQSRRWRNVYATAVSASFISASLLGTASFAISASHASGANYALTASYIITPTNAFIQDGNSFGTTARLGTNDDQNLIFETNGVQRITITSSGQVSIGTLVNPTASNVLTLGGNVGPNVNNAYNIGSSSSYWNTGYITNISASTISASTVYGNVIGTVTSASYSATASYIVEPTNAWLQGGNSFGLNTSTIGTLDNSNIRIDTNGTQRMLVSASGQVAIGSVAIPAYALTMGGHLAAFASNLYDLGSTSSLWRNIYGTRISASSISASTIYGNLAEPTNAFIQGGNSFGTTAILGTNDNQNLRLETNGNTTRIIISSGSATRVGIGSNPELAYTLTVLGHVGPQATNVYDLGATGSIWRRLHVGEISASLISSNLIGTASWATNTLTASYIGTGTNNYLPKWSNNTLTATSSIYDDNTNVGIGTNSPQHLLDIYNGKLALTNPQSSSTTMMSSGSTSVNSGSIDLINNVTFSSNNAAFIDYLVRSGSGANLRAGSIIAVWGSGSAVEWTEFGTKDIGNTEPVSFTFLITGSIATPVAQLRASVLTNGWIIKAFTRVI